MMTTILPGDSSRPDHSTDTAGTDAAAMTIKAAEPLAVTIPADTDDPREAATEAGSPLRRALTDAATLAGCSMTDLTVLSVQNDPFRVDTPAGHRDGAWLATTAKALSLGDRKIHLRGFHYMVIGQRKPDGTKYTNTDKDWLWLVGTAGKAARWLGYVPFDQITDHRNAAPEVQVFTQPIPRPYLNVGIDVWLPDADELTPEIGVKDFTGVQPYKLALFGEKSSLNDVLAPLARQYGADLYLPTGEISDTLMYQMARVGAEDGRPMVVLCFSDADPAGWQMPVSIGRKLQAFKALGEVDVPVEAPYGGTWSKSVDFGGLDFEVHNVALTPDQVRLYGLPSTPLKATELRGDNWRRVMQVEQTEIDALASLRPDLLAEIAKDAIAPFNDLTLAHRVSVARQAWVTAAQAHVDQAMGAEQLDQIRADAAVKLEAMQDEINEINDALRVDADDFDLPEMVVPTAVLSGASNGKPLVDSRRPFTEQCRGLIDHKAYRIGGGAQ
jgi:hypothetical protein